MAPPGTELMIAFVWRCDSAGRAGSRGKSSCAAPRPRTLGFGRRRSRGPAGPDDPDRGEAQAGAAGGGVLDRRHWTRPFSGGSSRKAVVPSGGRAAPSPGGAGASGGRQCALPSPGARSTSTRVAARRRASARCACRSSRISPAASTPATPAIAAKQGSLRADRRPRESTLQRVSRLATSAAEGVMSPGVAFVSLRVWPHQGLGGGRCRFEIDTAVWSFSESVSSHRSGS
jgi:hypothetical protein